MKKRLLTVLLAISILCTTIFTATISVSANSNVYFGSPNPSNVTVYCNDSAKSKSTITIPIANYSSQYKYYTVSDNRSVATVSGKVSSSRISATIYAQKVGTTKIRVYAKNSKGQMVSNTRTVNVKVLARDFSTSSLRKTSVTSNSISVAWTVKSKAYIDCFRIEYSTDNFRTYKSYDLSISNSSCKLTGLSRNKTYYIRIVSISSYKNSCAYFYHRSNVVNATTRIW